MPSRSVERSAVLALSRKLRGLLDNVCARRSAEGRSGRRDVGYNRTQGCSFVYGKAGVPWSGSNKVCRCSRTQATPSSRPATPRRAQP